MDLAIIILSEESQTEEDKYHIISLTCGILKKIIQINVFSKQKQTHRLTGRGIDWEFEIDMCTLPYLK